MAYEKQNFKSGEKLYASQLNAMDEQITKNSEDVNSLSEEIEALKAGGGNGGSESTRQNIEYTLAIGSIMASNGGINAGNTTRASTEGFLYVSKGTVIEFRLAATHQYAVYYFNEANTKTDESGWITEKAYVLKSDAKIKVMFSRLDNAVMTDTELAVIKDGVDIYYEPQSEDDAEAEKIRNDIIQSLNIEYGRSDGASWQFVRIPAMTNDGRIIRPAVRLTSEDGSLSGEKCSAAAYADRENTAFVINAGLFDVETKEPLGQTVIDGVSIVNEPHPQGANGETISETECYPLCIDEDGALSAPYDKHVDTATMIADGVVHACTGWVKILENYEIQADEIATEIVHPQPYVQQIIGQYHGGDYCVLTVANKGYAGSDPNDNGLTYTQCAQILVDKGVKFGYALDGGGSCQTVVGKRLINPKFDGRKVPAVIVFEAAE